jgi:hypothetical protein
MFIQRGRDTKPSTPSLRHRDLHVLHFVQHVTYVLEEELISRYAPFAVL